MPYSYKNAKGVTYYLYSTLVTLRSGSERVIYFFAKEADRGEKKGKWEPSIPEGYEVIENERTGLPVLRKA